MNIALTKEMEDLIHRRVSTGMYNNASEVVRDALRHMEDNDPYSELRAALVPRIAKAKAGELSNKSVKDIIAEAKKEVKGR